VQLLIILAWCPEDLKVTSDAIAFSVNTNPALIRRIMGYLKKADLISVAPGTGGMKLARDIDQITLLDVYRAMELTDEDRLFGLHETQNPRCPIGNRINQVLLAAPGTGARGAGKIPCQGNHRATAGRISALR